MTRRSLRSLLHLTSLTALLTGCGPAVQQAATSTPSSTDLLARQQTRLDGTVEDLSKYHGKVVLIVNTASKCGFTPQYAGLEALYKAKQSDGLVILGFPSNDFMGQEPGTSEQIAEFCQQNYGVTFPMFQKVKVKGADADPLFRDLAALAGEPSWNFNKYLLDREGHLVARFGSNVRPDDPRITDRVDQLLAADESPSQPPAG